MKRYLSIVFAILACCVFGRTHSLTLWRGETLVDLLPDTARFDEGPLPDIPGLTVKVFALNLVAYAKDAASLDRSFRLDRLDSMEKGPGLRHCVEITADRDMKPGTYVYGPLTLEIKKSQMPTPKERRVYLDLWQHPWAVSSYFKVEPFSDEHFALMKKVLVPLATAGQRALTVTILDEPWNHQCNVAYHSMIGRVRHDDGSWSYDWTNFDKYVAMGDEAGIGPDIACYTMCPWGNQCAYENDKGERQVMVCKAGTSEFEAFWGPFLSAFAAHLKEKGWYERTVIAMDERSPEEVKAICDFVAARAPGLRIAMAGNIAPSKFQGCKIDIYSQIISFVTPEFLEEAAKRRKDGFVTTYYVCCGPWRPNTFMTSPLAESFWLGAYPGVSGLDGFLRWAWNSWSDVSHSDASVAPFPAGDSLLIYPPASKNEEPCMSLRFCELRNGLNASEKLRILGEKAENAAKIDALRRYFSPKDAMDGKVNMQEARKAVQDFVNSVE